jgi:hypothetical protein
LTVCTSHPHPSVESESEWENQLKAFGFNNENRKQGNEHSLRGLEGAFKTRINLITVRTSEHRIEQYNPPENILHTEEIWLIYLDFAHTRHIPLTTTRSANVNSARPRRATGSMESINDPTPAVGSSSRNFDSVPFVQTPRDSQSTEHYSQPMFEDFFANIRHVKGDFVHRLIQNGALNFIHETYNAGTLWTPRDCRIQRTSPTGSPSRNSQSASP